MTSDMVKYTADIFDVTSSLFKCGVIKDIAWGSVGTFCILLPQNGKETVA